MDVGKWLRDLGLGQYEAAFRESSIDGQSGCHSQQLPIKRQRRRTGWLRLS